MDASSNVETTVRDFVDIINAHNTHAIVARCTHDHVLVDSLGTRLTGSNQLRKAWEGYFALFPDYHIQVETLAVAGNCVLLSGWASATHVASSSKWCIPAAWRALVSKSHIAQWQVFADNKPVYEILSRDA